MVHILVHMMFIIFLFSFFNFSLRFVIVLLFFIIQSFFLLLLLDKRETEKGKMGIR